MADKFEQLIPYEHNKLHRISGPESFYWWYFDAEFEEGYTAKMILFPHSIGMLDGYNMGGSDALVLITIITPQGQSLTELQPYPATALKSTPVGLDAKIGNNQVRFNGKSYYVKFMEGDLGVELDMVPILPPWSPLGNKTRIDSELMANLGIKTDYYLDYVEFMPRGSAKGTLCIKNNPIQVKGIGYHEQGFGNFYLGRMIDNWFWTKHYLDEYTLVLGGGNLNEQFANVANARITGLLLGRNDQIIFSHLDLLGTQIEITHLESKTLPQTKEKFPSKVKISLNIEDVNMEILITYLFLQFGIGFEYPSKLLTRKYKPTLLHYISETEAKFTIGNKTEKKKGRGVYEVMLCGLIEK